MKVSTSQIRRHTVWALALGMFATTATTGCQVDVGGQTLPSPYWPTDDVQYFPPGHEFKLYNEAAAMNATRQQQTPAGLPAGEALPPGPPMPAGPVAIPGGM